MASTAFNLGGKKINLDGGIALDATNSFTAVVGKTYIVAIADIYNTFIDVSAFISSVSGGTVLTALRSGRTIIRDSEKAWAYIAIIKATSTTIKITEGDYLGLGYKQL